MHPALVGLGFVSVVWAGGYVAASVAVGPSGGFGPLWLPAVRLVVAGALLLALARVQRVALPPVEALGSVCFAGCLAWMGGSGLATLGQVTVPAGTTTLILGAGPLVALAIEALRTRRRPSWASVAWVVLGLVGLALAVGPTAVTSLSGVIFVGLAGLAWASSGVLEAERPDSHGHPLALAGVQMLAAGLGMTVVALAFREPLPQPTVAGWLGFAWLTFVCAVVAVPVWLWVLRRLPVSVSMNQTILTPIAALGLDAWMLGQSLGPQTLVGSALVLGAAWASARGPATLSLDPTHPTLERRLAR